MPATATKKNRTKSTQKKAAKRTFVSFVLDESGSMEEQKNSAIMGFNEYTGGLRQDGSIAFTLTKFNTSCTIVHDGRPIKEIPDLNDGTYKPDGFTALLDAVGDTIEAVDRKLGRDDRALIVILTDGHENSSRRFTSAAIRDLIQTKQKEGNWTFVFLGSTADAWDVGANMGIARGNVIRTDPKEVKATMRAVSCSTRAMTANCSLRATANFAAIDGEAKMAWHRAGAASQS